MSHANDNTFDLDLSNVVMTHYRVEREDKAPKAKSVTAVVYEGDNLPRLKKMLSNSVDSVVTDPPYGIGFMGKGWDKGVPSTEFWKEVFRVLKPGGYLLSFGGTRTYHRMVVNIEDAGFEIRDQIAWLYGEGMPKTRSLSKDIDRIMGAQREVVGKRKQPGYGKLAGEQGKQTCNVTEFDKMSDQPVSSEAAEWDGWQTALKPAQEPIVVARKPHVGSIASNLLTHGVGGFNIDACRVGDDGGTTRSHQAGYGEAGPNKSWRSGHSVVSVASGRFPANVIHDGSPAVMEVFPFTRTTKGKKKAASGYGGRQSERGDELSMNGGDAGSAGRYFYCAKPSKAERKQASSEHITIKPVALMRYLVRLVTPMGATTLDPFAGSGSTGAAALAEGVNVILMEREANYAEGIRRRLADHIVEGTVAPDSENDQERLWDDAEQARWDAARAAYREAMGVAA